MAKRILPIEFPPIHTTERGDGVVIHWTGQRTSHSHPFRWVCASVEGTHTVKRMTKYLREEDRP